MDGSNTSTVGLRRRRTASVSTNASIRASTVPAPTSNRRRHGGSANSGCEDPRTVVIGDRLYLTYTAYDSVNPPKGALTSISLDDFRARKFDRWEAPMLVTPENVDDKDLALLPEPVDGRYVLYHRINSQICADLFPDLSFEKRASRCIEVLSARRGMWDGAKVGIAGPPIKVPGGWLMIYHGVSRHATYRLGAALLDPSGLTVLARAADPIFEPLESYERKGEVADVVFSCGAVARGDTLYLYYGAADKVLGVATASLAHILAALS